MKKWIAWVLAIVLGYFSIMLGMFLILQLYSFKGIGMIEPAHLGSIFGMIIITYITYWLWKKLLPHLKKK